MGCGKSKSVKIENSIVRSREAPNQPTQSNTAGQVNTPGIQQTIKQPLDRYDKLPKQVLGFISGIFGQFGQIDPHRKRPVPKLAKIQAKQKELGVVVQERPGTVPGQLSQIRGKNAPDDPSTRKSRQGKRGAIDAQQTKDPNSLPPGLGNAEEDFPMAPLSHHGPKGIMKDTGAADPIPAYDIPIVVTSGAPEDPSDQQESKPLEIAPADPLFKTIQPTAEAPKEETTEEDAKLAAELAAKEAEVKRLESFQREGKLQVEQEEQQLLDLEVDGVITAGDKVEVRTYEAVPVSNKQEGSSAPAAAAAEGTFSIDQRIPQDQSLKSLSGEIPQAFAEDDFGTKPHEEPLPMNLPENLLDKDFFSDDEPAEQYEITEKDKEQEQLFTKAGRDSPEPPRLDLIEVNEGDEDLPPGVTKEELRATRLELERKVTIQGQEIAAQKRAEYDAQLEQDKNKAKTMEEEAAMVMTKYNQ